MLTYSMCYSTLCCIDSGSTDLDKGNHNSIKFKVHVNINFQKLICTDRKLKFISSNKAKLHGR